MTTSRTLMLDCSRHLKRRRGFLEQPLVKCFTDTFYRHLMKTETEEMTMENYSQYSHAGYDVLEGDIIRELMELKKLSDEDKAFELRCLA